MVEPRFPFLDRLARAEQSTRQRLGGLMQRGRVVRVNDTYAPASVDVEIQGYAGQTATARGVLVLSTNYRALNIPAPPIGAEVLVLVPTGNISHGGYVVGLVAKPAALVDNLGNAATDTLPTVYQGASWSVVAVTDTAATDRTLTLTGLALALAAGANVRALLWRSPLARTSGPCWW